MNGLELKNHFSLVSTSEVSQICDSALSSIGITYFNYIKIHSDGSRELLTNNAFWIDHFSTKIIELHAMARKEFYHELIQKIVGRRTEHKDD